MHTADFASEIPAERKTPMQENVVLRSLGVRDFRNLARVDLEPPPDGFALVGENGHGKTNLLEAIYYLQLLRSARGARDMDLVRFGAPAFRIVARVETPGEHVVSAGFERATRRKKVVVDGVEPARLSDALGALPAVLFSPRDVDLVAGAPSERRRYLDITLALTSRRYLVALQQYRGALVRRNAALRDAARGPFDARAIAKVEVWEPALARHGALLWSERARWVAQSADAFAQLCEAIGERGDGRLRYAVAPSVGRSTDAASASVAEAQGALEAALASQRAHDVRHGLTHVGPHRDDLELTLDARALRIFGSAGQQRTAAMALRLLEGATLRERLGRMPLVLLDDPFAELDVRRAGRILQLLANAGMGQTMLAVPREADIPEGMTSLARLRIADGVVTAGG